jgi:hypothetical protein
MNEHQERFNKVLCELVHEYQRQSEKAPDTQVLYELAVIAYRLSRGGPCDASTN